LRINIIYLAANQILEGFPDGSFRPNEPVTRAQFAAIVRKAFKTGKVRDAIAFRDVSSRHWAYGAIRGAYELGFLTGVSRDEFNPERRLTRQEILISLTNGLRYSFTGSTTEMLSAYADGASIPSNLRNLIAAATQNGLVVAYPDIETLNLSATVTRAEVAAYVYQALVSRGEMVAISSPYVISKQIQGNGTAAMIEHSTEIGDRQHCNPGLGNGSEGCDPGYSAPHGGSNDWGLGEHSSNF
jgi:hypothetical protein